MDNFNFEIAGDILVRNEINSTDQPDVFTIKKVPVISKDIFIQLYNEWIKEGKDVVNTTAE